MVSVDLETEINVVGHQPISCAPLKNGFPSEPCAQVSFPDGPYSVCIVPH